MKITQAKITLYVHWFFNHFLKKLLMTRTNNWFPRIIGWYILWSTITWISVWDSLSGDCICILEVPKILTYWPFAHFTWGFSEGLRRFLILSQNFDKMLMKLYWLYYPNPKGQKLNKNKNVQVQIQKFSYQAEARSH